MRTWLHGRGPRCRNDDCGFSPLCGVRFATRGSLRIPNPLGKLSPLQTIPPDVLLQRESAVNHTLQDVAQGRIALSGLPDLEFFPAVFEFDFDPINGGAAVDA